MKGHDLSSALQLLIGPPGEATDLCDELVRLIGDALGDREVPADAVDQILQAVAIIAMYPDAQGRSADVVFTDAEHRFATHPVIARERQRMTARYGADVADAALQELHDVGQSIIASLGTRHLPHDACNLVGAAASAIADHTTGVRGLGA